MRFEPYRPAWLLVAATALSLALACSDSTAPPLSRRIAGTYALTSTLTSYTYSNSCRPTSNGTVCTDTTVVVEGMKMDGTFMLVDATDPRSTTNMAFTVPDAVLHVTSCDPIASSCTAAVSSYSGSATVHGDSLEFEAPLYGSVEVFLKGNVIGDEIQGGVIWYTYLGCCAHQYYTGTFIAKRQR